MRVATDYIRHCGGAARKCAGDPLGGAPEAPIRKFYRTLAKALEEIAPTWRRRERGVTASAAISHGAGARRLIAELRRAQRIGVDTEARVSTATAIAFISFRSRAQPRPR